VRKGSEGAKKTPRRAKAFLPDEVDRDQGSRARKTNDFVAILRASAPLREVVLLSSHLLRLSLAFLRSDLGLAGSNLQK
jgi:hypothetical protein